MSKRLDYDSKQRGYIAIYVFLLFFFALVPVAWLFFIHAMKGM